MPKEESKRKASAMNVCHLHLLTFATVPTYLESLSNDVQHVTTFSPIHSIS